VKPNALGKLIDTFAAKKKVAIVGKISVSGNKPNAPTISIKANAKSADIVQLSINAKNASQNAEASKPITGTKPLKVTPPAEHPEVARIKAIMQERYGVVIQAHESFYPPELRVKAPPDGIIYDASGLSEGINSGEIQLIDSGLRVDPMSTQTYLENMNFFEGSIQEIISGAFSGNMGKAEANLVATEISHLIKSASVNNGNYLEDRAVNRELGLRLAEHYANIFIDNQDDVSSFMEVMRSFAARDEMLDKGYRFNGAEMYEYYKPIPGNAWQQNHWDSNVSNKDKERMANEFAANVKKTEDILNNSRATVSNDDVTALLKQIQEKLDMINDAVDESNIIPNYQWLNEVYDKHWSVMNHHAMDGVTNFKIDLTQKGITEILQPVEE